MKLCMQHRELQTIISFSKGDRELTLTYFTAKSFFETFNAFLQEIVKTTDFSETIAACDLKVGRCRQIIERMEYVSNKVKVIF